MVLLKLFALTEQKQTITCEMLLNIDSLFTELLHKYLTIELFVFFFFTLAQVKLL